MLSHSQRHAAVPSKVCSLRMKWRAITAVVATALLFGSNSGTALGAISIAGDVSVSTSNPNSQAIIGNQAFGSIQIDGGSLLTTGQITIAQSQAGIGFATVTGAGSRWSFTGTADIGVSGVGRFDVLNGAVVSQSQFGTFRIATQSNGHGTVRVEGLGSLLQVSDQLLIGGNLSQGLLQIANGALVNVPFDFTQNAVQGRIEFAGGTLRTIQLINHGVVAG